MSGEVQALAVMRFISSEHRIAAIDRTSVTPFIPLGRGFELEGGFWVDRALRHGLIW
jgi:hypothetical protein